jgi:hypothetical protein
MCSERGRAGAIRALAFGAIVTMATMSGCATTHVKDSAVDHAATSATELDFWQGLETQPLLSNHDALHGLLLLADQTDDRAGFAERLAEARKRGWVRATAELDPDAAATIGLVSVALCEVLKVDGGLSMKLLGLTPRYCTRELIDAGLLPDRSPNQVVRGPEFLELVARAEDWRSAHGGAP